MPRVDSEFTFEEAVAWLHARAGIRCDRPVSWSLDDVAAVSTIVVGLAPELKQEEEAA